ncbi:MAG: protein kinase [Gemmatales bacterium]|nr:protein kinase [Gemmatales bacterium]
MNDFGVNDQVEKPGLGVAHVVQVLAEQGWQFEERLGRGGFGEVYRARVNNVLRAVRISFDPVAEQSAVKEKQIIEDLAQLQLITHPRLVSLISYHLVLGYLVTVWELADEPVRDLARLLHSYRQQNQPGIPRDKLIRYIWHLAEAIDFLNGRGLYHRDIKPENCLLFQGEVKLADFGLTRFASLSQTRLSTGPSGTVGYAPPEAWEGKIHRTCDLYALAVMYAYLATGRHPFGAGEPNSSPVAVIERQRRGEWDLRGLSRSDAALVELALQPDPQRRFPKGARAWVRELDQGQEEPREHSPAANAPERKNPHLVVKPGQSLAEAVDRVPEGGVILLEPGTYRLSQPLRITKALTIEGTDSQTTTIACDAERVVFAYEGGGRFRLVKLTVIHSGNQPANIIEANSGIIELEDCIFRGAVWSEEKKLGGNGLWLHGVVRATVRNCRCIGNAVHGIHVSEYAQTVLDSNICEENRGNGISYFDNAGGTAQNNTCRNNGCHGIEVCDKAQPVLEGNNCEGNGTNGICYR